MHDEQTSVEFPILALITYTTGKLLCELEHVYKLGSHVVGYSIFTHEFPMVWEGVRKVIIAQHSDLADIDVSHITRDNYKEESAILVEKYGGPRRVFAMKAQREKSPLETLRELKPDVKVIVVSPEGVEHEI